MRPASWDELVLLERVERRTLGSGETRWSSGLPEDPYGWLGTQRGRPLDGWQPALPVSYPKHHLQRAGDKVAGTGFEPATSAE